MGNFKTSVLAQMLTAYVVKSKGDSNPTEDRLYKLERITQNLVNELNEKERRIEKLETIVAGQRKELQTQNNAVMELNEVIIQREHQNDENTKRLNELEHFVRSLSQQYRSQQQSVARDKAVRPEDKLNLLEDYKGQDVPTTDPQNKENVRTNESLSYRADFQQYQIRHHGQRDVSRIRRQSYDNVAFHAYLKGSRCYGSHETFVFDVEETDIGDAYNVHDGIFDVPVTGTYVFTVTTVSMSRRYYSAEIIINGVVKGISFADAEEVGDFHSGTATIVVHVNAGDHVFVRRGAAASNNCDVYSLDVYGRTTFSGQESGNVAFYVYLSENRFYSNHETIVFDVEETDIGNNYNVHDGIFDVPTSGTYVFTLMVASKVFRHIQAEIVVDGTVKGVAFADTSDISDMVTSTATIVVRVNAGDHVFVRKGPNSFGNCDLASDYLKPYGNHVRTTFSGWKLF